MGSFYKQLHSRKRHGKMAIFISYVPFILLPKVNPFSFKSWTPLLKVMRSLADLGWTKNLTRRYNGRNKFIPRASRLIPSITQCSPIISMCLPSSTTSMLYQWTLDNNLFHPLQITKVHILWTNGGKQKIALDILLMHWDRGLAQLSWRWILWKTSSYESSST